MSFPSPLLKMTSVCVIALTASACQPSSPKPSRPEQPSGHATAAPPAPANQERSLKELSPPLSPGDPVIIHHDAPSAPTPKAPPALALSILEREKTHPGDRPHKDWRAAGREHFKTQRYEEAVIAFRKALSTAPTDGEAWFLLGKAYLQALQPERGLECFEEALKQSPTSAALHAALIRGHLKAGNNDQALTHATNLGRLTPATFQSSYLLGRAYSGNAMWKESMQAFAQALTHKPSHPYANNNLGFVALQVGDLDTAVPALERATGAPNAVHYMFNNLGIAYERNKQALEALTAFRQALELNPRYVKAIVNRDRVFASLSEAQHTALAALRDGAAAPQEEVHSITTDATLAVALPEDAPTKSAADAGTETLPETTP